MKDGRWRVTVRVTSATGAKSNKLFYGKNQREAQNKALAFRAKNPRLAANAPHTVAQLLDVCIAGPWADHRTLREFKRISEIIKDSPLGQRDPRFAATSDVWGFLTASTTKGRTRQTYRNVLSSAFNYGRKIGWCDDNPARDLRIGAPKVRAREPLTEQQFAKVVQCRRWGHVWEFMGTAGLRPKEVMALRELDRREDGWWAVVVDSKTDAATRKVPVSNTVAMRWKPLECNYYSIGRAWNLVRGTLVDASTSVYELRKYAITQWIKSGLSEDVVRVLAGHSSIVVTKNVYRRVSDDELAEARKVGMSKKNAKNVKVPNK